MGGLQERCIQGMLWGCLLLSPGLLLLPGLPLRMSLGGVLLGGMALLLWRLMRLQANANAALRRSHEAAAALAEARSTFLAVLSHEIRNPLAATIGLLEQARREDSGPEREELLSIAASSTNHLLRILDDTLDLSRIEAGRLSLESVALDLDQILAEVRSIWGERAREASLRLRLHREPDLMPLRTGDPVRVKQILFNLVGNALKFTAAGGEVRVQLSVPPCGSGIQVEVADTGIGMSAEELRRVFEPFTQATAGTASRYGGSGLGLAIVRRLVEQMEGTLHAESAPGEGSRFRVTLPLPCRAQVCAVPSRTAARSRPDPLHILVAEDNPVNQFLVRRQLSQDGHTVEVVGDGQQAIQAAQREGRGFDVILMDVVMPDTDGYTATARLRAAGYTGRILGLSASVLAADVAQAQAAGMDGYLSKPLRLEALYDALEMSRGTVGELKQGMCASAS